MKPEQETIWYLAGDSAEGLKASPQLEGFAARGVEVLLLEDQVDAFWPERMEKFEGKNIRSITQDTAELAKIAPEHEQVGEAADLTKLIEALKAGLGEEVSDVRGTDRLTDSAVVLAGSGAGPDLQMQRLLKRSGQNYPSAAPVLELNPRHALIRHLADQATNGDDLTDVANILLDLARVQDGEAPKHPGAFARRVTAALTKQ
jgi:molecular chaperone HtpG